MASRANLGLLAVAFALMLDSQAWGSDRDQRIALRGEGGSGSVRFRDRGRDARLEIELEHLNLAAGTVLKIEIDGQVVGSLVTGNGRTSRVELRARHGQALPAIGPGSVIVVVGPNGVVLLRGKF